MMWVIRPPRSGATCTRSRLFSSVTTVYGRMYRAKSSSSRVATVDSPRSLGCPEGSQALFPLGLYPAFARGGFSGFTPDFGWCRSSRGGFGRGGLGIQLNPEHCANLALGQFGTGGCCFACQVRGGGGLRD